MELKFHKGQKVIITSGIYTGKEGCVIGIPEKGIETYTIKLRQRDVLCGTELDYPAKDLRARKVRGK